MPRAKALPRAHSLMPRGSADVGERILLVDDDVDFAEATVEYLAMQGFDCMSVHTADAFLGSIRDFEPQVALIDQRLGKDSGMSLLETLAAEFPHVVPIMMTGYGNTDSAVQALRRSAYDFLRKPVDPEDLVAALERALERQRLIRRGRDAELALLASEEKFSKAFIANPAAMAIVSMRDRQVVEVNESFEAFAGYLRTEVIGKTLAALGLWTDAADGEHFVEALRVDGKVRGRAMRLTSRTLGVRECVVSAVVVTIGGQTCAILSIEDLTRERVATRALGESEQRFRSLYHKMPAILLTLDPSGTIKSANAFGADMLGYEAEALIGASFHEYLLPDSRGIEEEFVRRCFDEPRRTHDTEICVARRGGDAVWLRQTGQVTPGNDGAPELLVVCEDVTVAKELSEQLSYQAAHDGLTGLVNRREFERRLTRVLETARSDNSMHALCYLDLDQFKVINDTCGHIAGDELLKQVCDLLKSCVRKHDTLARLGGDEFAILMEHCDIERARRVSGKVHEAMLQYRFSWDGRVFGIGVSIGMVPVDASFTDVQDILRAADTACYAAKDKGSNREHLYSADDADLARRHGEMQWVARIGDALDHDRFVLYQQEIIPLTNAAGGRHLEILVRLQQADGELVSPGLFFPAAERYELSLKIDQWVLRHTLAWMHENPQSLANTELVCINLSGRSLGDEHFAAFVEELFEASGVAPASICFEVTETAAIKNLVNARRFINELRERGCRFALDDFGTGLSSFAYLRNLPVDAIKIDGQFVSGIDTDPVKFAMVRSINEIGKVMGKATIAEYVESAAALEIVRELGVDMAQGYHIARPAPLGD